MNEWLKKLIEQVKGLWQKWSTMQKIVLFSVVGVTVIGVIVLIAFTSSPSMIPLLGRPISDEALLNRISVKLDEEIPGLYEIKADNTIMVKDTKTARRVRAILIREDLVPMETDPWDIFDVERWTKTEFDQKVNLRRAITREIEQHLLALDEIDAAKVIIDMPEDTLFSEDQKPYTASIQITPKPGSTITSDRKKIEGIVKLVKLAVSGLTDENIVITDNTGQELNIFDSEAYALLDRHEITVKQLKEKQKLEQDYKKEILQELRKIFPEDRIDIVKMEIDLDMSKETSHTEEYIPMVIKKDNPDTAYDDSQILESTTLSKEQRDREWKGMGINPEGPPGTEGQTPSQYKDLSNYTGELKESSVIENRAVGKKETDREERPWEMNRKSISVSVDGYWIKKYDEETGKLLFNKDGSIVREYVPVTDEELKKVEKLVKDAIGYDAARRDSVSVVHLQKDRRAQQETEDNKYRQQRDFQNFIFWALVGIGAVLIAAVLFRMLSRYLERKRQEKEEELARQHQAMREAALRTAEEQGMEVELSIEERARLEMQENAINMAREHPEDVAQLIRTWLMEE